MSTIKQKRMTKQKRVVYDILFSTDTHPTVDWIYQRARTRVPDISLGTVYRNLQVLREENKIIELNYGKNQNRYDANIEPHYHFVCDTCGQVLDFPEDTELVPQQILLQAPGQVLYHRMECYGTCTACLAAEQAGEVI